MEVPIMFRDLHVCIKLASEGCGYVSNGLKVMSVC